MEQQEIWLEILKLCRKKYNCATEILRITKELGVVLGGDDQISAQMLLGMRQEEMDEWSGSEEKIQFLASSYPDLEGRIRWLMRRDASPEFCENEEETKVLELCRKSRDMLDQTVAIDKVINQKIAGEDSFYKK